MRLLSLPAAVLLLAASPGVTQTPAPTPEPTEPPIGGVRITSCSLEYSERTHVAAKLHVEFMNMNDQPVTRIRFRIRAGFQTFPVMDFGKFAPDLLIKHDLDPPEMPVAIVQGVPGADGLYCSIDAFTLSDGYTWVSPTLQAELQQQQKP